MEINRITFEQIANDKGIDRNFDELDLNNDGKITSVDLDLAEKGNIKKSIADILGELDKEENIVLVDEMEEVSMSKAGAWNNKKNTQDDEWYDITREQSARDGIPVTDTEHFQEDVLNSTGVTYVVMGYLGGCAHCNSLEESLAQIKDDLNGVCNIYNMSWGENTDLCRDLAYNQAGISKPASFPCVLTFYNGKLVKSTPVDEVVRETTKKVAGGGVLVDRQYIASATAKSQWYSSTSDSLYNYIDESTGQKKPCRVQEQGGLKWVHKPQLLEDIKADVARITSEPDVIRDSKGQLRTTAERFSYDVEGSKGTTYVVMGCIGCNSMLMSEISKHQSELDKVANIFQIDWEAQNNTALCRKIAYEMGNVGNPAHFPVVAKFVDGKFVEIIPNTTNSTSWRDDAIEILLAKAEGTPMRNQQIENNNGAETAENNEEVNDTSEADKAAAAREEELKNELMQVEKDLEEKVFRYSKIQIKLEEIQSEYKKQEAELEDAEEDNKSSIQSSMSDLKLQKDIYQAKATSLQAEITQLKHKYFSLSG